MNITYNDVKKVFDTLPIGYYLGMPLDAKLDKMSNDSFYIFDKKIIVISYPTIQKALSETSIDIDLEEITRGLLYHELSHALLSYPLQNTQYNYNQLIMNIFEDERIETICQNMYLNTNFEKLLYAICGNDIKTMDYKYLSPEQKFFLAVRFDIGTVEQLEQKRKIMNNYCFVDNFIGYVDDYIEDVDKYFEKYFCSCEYATSEKENENLQQLKDNLFNNYDIENNEDIFKIQAQQEKNAEDKQLLKISTKELKEFFKNRYGDKDFSDLLERLKQILNKSQVVQKMTGGANCGYSGVISPKLCNRLDYKYFLHSNPKGNQKGFSKFHLNLFIDVSGSFYYNTIQTNRLLKALQTIEEQNPDFTFNLITINTDVQLKNKKDRFIRCRGGNKLPLYIKNIYLQAIKRDAINYNIVLFDGDCLSDVGRVESQLQLKNFVTTFDKNNTTIISDSENSKYFDKKFAKAKIIYSHNYVKELTNNVCKTLQIAFR